jgi:type 2 lantibiotic biosynthesis protein LanM
VRALAQTLSESHLDEQIDILREALTSSVDTRFRSGLMLPGTTEGESPADLTTTFQEYAVWVGRELLATAFQEGGHWAPSAQPRSRKGQEPLVAMNLYSGTAGVGLFMAALAAVTGDDTFKSASMSTVEHLRQFLDRPDAQEALQAAPLGACDGIGSIVYGLSWMGRLLEDPSIVDLAVRFSQHISEWKIASDPHLDVTGGAAGAILGLLALHQQAPDAGSLDLAVRCGDHLIMNQIATPGGGGAWPVQGKHFLAGFAHGAAGIAYALIRLAQLTGKPELQDAAERGHRYERILFSPAKGNWPVVVRRSVEGVPERSKFMTAWCHGAPGVGLARALVFDVVREDEILDEIDAAIRTTAHLELSGSDHLCCGNLGRNDVLLTMGLRLGKPELVDSAKAVGVQVASRAHEKGHFRLPSTPFTYSIFTPGFFQGLSGIGYQLLRNAVPDRLPSVLSFEANLISAA